MASLLTLTFLSCRSLLQGIFVGFIASIIITSQLYGQSAIVHPFLTATAIATQQTLKAPAEVIAPTSSLQMIVDQVSIERKVSIWIDRRVVRDRQVRVEAKGLTIGQLLKDAANQVEAGLLPMDGVVAVVPLSSLEAFASAYWELSATLATKSNIQLRAIGFGWNEGTNAPEAFRKFMDNAGLQATGIDVPWDVWRGFEFRGASAASVCVCLLGGFDLVLVNEDNVWKTMSMLKRYDAGKANWKRFAWSYSASEIDRIPVPYRESWRKRWPSAEITKIAKPNGSKVIASAISHWELIEPLVPAPKPSAKPKAIELSGTIQGTVGGLLASLARTYQFKFDLNLIPAKTAQRELSVKVDKVSLEELIRRIGKEADMDLSLEGNEIRVQQPK